MVAASRPRIALLGRFAEHTSATRSGAIVTARKLAESVWAAGGEPITLLPTDDHNWDARLSGFQGVLLPGGGDIDPAAYGQKPETEHLYGIDELQDAADLSLARWAIDRGVPLLAICRGFQIVNVVQGGTLVQHMPQDHRHVVHSLKLDADVDRLGLSADRLESSCYHHQALDRLGRDLRVIATASEGHAEAFAIENGGWAYGLQWHPEDNAASDLHQAEIFKRFVEQASAHPAF
jgi:putative glutamine amidotransferase